MKRRRRLQFVTRFIASVIALYFVSWSKDSYLTQCYDKNSVNQTNTSSSKSSLLSTTVDFGNGHTTLSCSECFPAIVVFSLVRDDLLSTFLASIDLVTDHVFVIINSLNEGRHQTLQSTASRFDECNTQHSAKCANPNIRHFHILSSAENIGFAGSYNLALRALIDYRFPYVLFNNDDTKFLPGRLIAAKRIMDSTHSCMFYFEGFSSFGISLEGIAKLGPMDENFWPAYAEDCDYWFRAQLNNCSLFYRARNPPSANVDGGQEESFVTHGDGTHKSSTTHKSSKEVADLVQNTLDARRGRFAYLVRKWGFNTCDIYHEKINQGRSVAEVLTAMSLPELQARGMSFTRPYGTMEDVNAWDKYGWKQEGSVTPRGKNSGYAPAQIVWSDADNMKLRSFADNISGLLNTHNSQQSLSTTVNRHPDDLHVQTAQVTDHEEFSFHLHKVLNTHSSRTREQRSARSPSNLEQVDLKHPTDVHIPVVIVPVLSERNLITRCIRSIDVPVVKIILILNSLPDNEGLKALNALHEEIKALSAVLGDNLVVVKTGMNVGYGNSINIGMKLTPWASWWLCTNADVRFPPSSLRSVIPTIQRETASGTMLFMLGIHFSAVVLTKHLIHKVGYFDEVIWPAYVEDCDLMLRVRLFAGDMDADVENFNGSDFEAPGHYRYLYPTPGLEHVGQQGSANLLAQRISTAHANNIQYYLRKWGISRHQWSSGRGKFASGCGIPFKGQYMNPFNMSENEYWENLPFVREHLQGQLSLFS